MDQIEFDFDAPADEQPVPTGKRVGLFVTCLVDLFRPVVGFSSVKLLEEAGFEVDVPQNQICCGQTAHHSGDKKDAQDQAREVIKTFEGFDYVVAPSKSCALMFQNIYPDLLADDPAWAYRAQAIADKSFDLISFLHDVAAPSQLSSRFHGSIAYHSSSTDQENSSSDHSARALLSKLDAIEFREMNNEKTAATNSIRIDAQIPKTIIASGAGPLLSDDLGHLMDLARLLKRDGSAIEVRHVAEVLADMADGPAIGEKQSSLRNSSR
jgi:L-lactate dehydrogenase complex protein LldE